MSSIAVVVVCRGSGRALDDLLFSAGGQTRPAAELLIADASSDDPFTRAVLGRLEAQGHRVIRSGPSEAAARNAGAARCGAEYLVFLDQRSMPAPDVLAAAAQHLDADGGLEFVCAADVERGDAGHERAVRPWSTTWVEALGLGWIPGPTTMLRRTLWLRNGGEDESLGELASVDFWTRALSRGARGAVLGGGRAGEVVPRTSTFPVRAPRGDWIRLYQKHVTLVSQVGEDLLQRKVAALALEAARRAALRSQVTEAERELAPLMEAVEAMARQLAERGAARVEWGDLRRPHPLSPFWGSDRGKPLNRHYIEGFLASHRADVRGRVLEVKDSGYTRAFGTGVTRAEVLDVDPANRNATIVADLTRAETVPSDSFDCFILTQVLNVIFDVKAAVAEAFRVLRPGGVLLCTVAALDRVSYEGRALDGDFWRFTEASMRELLATAWPPHAIHITTYGNVMSCTAHLYGLAANELVASELDWHDPNFPLVVAARAVKPTSEPARP
jgi:SAM-dependent methyltransferase